MRHSILFLAGFAFIVFVLAELLGQARRQIWARFFIQALCLVSLSWSAIRLVGSPVVPVLAAASPERIIDEVVAICWWLVGARFATFASRLLLTLEAKPRESRILLDLLAAGIYVTAVLCIVSRVLEFPVRGLLATSGVIAIMLGLALQNTLGDLFSGIAVGVERPYRVGDQLSIDGNVTGRVMEVNWRSTRIKVGQDVVVVPNSTVAKSKLVNHSEPTLRSGESVQLRVHPEVPPGQVLVALRAALLSCEGLAPESAATAWCSDLAGDGATYTLAFAAPTMDEQGPVKSEVIAQAHRHLFHAGIPLAIPGSRPETGWRVRTLSAEELLARSDLFAGVSDHNRTLLSDHLGMIDLQAGGVLFRQGAEPTAMFMIAAGTIEVSTSALNPTGRRNLLSPGESLGLVALVTAQPYRTTATALIPVRAFRLDAEGLAAALAEAPGLEHELEDAVSRALGLMARFDVGETTQEGRERLFLLRRLRSFMQALR